MKYSLGYNGISTKVLKLSIPYISSFLTCICNRMTSGNFPMRLKFSEIKLKFKKGDKGNISNYRPISKLTSFSKIFEKVIFSRSYHHNNILVNEQFGFRKGLSTELVSYNLINNILSALNNISLVGGVFCDLQKAFDCVNCNILLSKMEFYGISGKANTLIKSYLCDRFKRVLTDYDSRKYSSEQEPVTHGVLHGSILGTLFFLLYINDLPTIIPDISNPILFAGDTSMIITNSGFHVFKKDIHSIIIQLNRWFKSHLLSLNLDKTHFLQFLTKNSHEIDLQISYENKQISKIHYTKVLGLIIDIICHGVSILMKQYVNSTKHVM